MVEISEKLLLEKGTPKVKNLEQIKTLNLSKLGLTHQDLPLKLLSRLRSLEDWDLSGNRLLELPRGLELPALRRLDLSDNQMEDVTTLESLSSLEELRMKDNLYITVSDNYKLMVLLPNLKIYNGKDVTSTANHLRFVYSDNLRTRTVAVWEKSFSLPDPVTQKSMAALERRFITAAREQVKFGPSSVNDFTKWKVEIIAQEFLRSLTEPKEDDDENRKRSEPEEKHEVSPPVKSKRPPPETDANICSTPHKKLRAGATVPAPGPRIQPATQPHAVRQRPRKACRPPPATPTPEDGARDRRRRDAVKGAPPQRDGAASLPTNTERVCLKPLHVLQCHSKQDSLEDFSTQLWACSFQPLPDSSGAEAGSRLVATCGGDSLCVIDCETGMVMKKYKVPGEEFFTLAWTTVLMSRGGNTAAQHCSVLAAGGKRGVVKLIHPRNNVAYGEFRASRRALSTLRFNHHQGNFIFTGSYDNKIVMWDIGGVDRNYNYKVVQLLVLDSSSTPLHLCLPPTSPGTHLLTACDNGLHCYNTQLGGANTTTTKRSKEMEIVFPVYKKEDEKHDYHTVDGLSFLSDDIVASKNHMHGCIYLWSWSRTRTQRPDRKSLALGAVVLAELQWANTEIPYLSLNTCPGRAYVVCGDHRGRLWMYHVSELQRSSDQQGAPLQPTEVLQWPTPVRSGRGPVDGPSINAVAMDPQLGYLVALSDQNMVVVWKREEKV